MYALTGHMDFRLSWLTKGSWTLEPYSFGTFSELKNISSPTTLLLLSFIRVRSCSRRVVLML